ncbi:hypothetical protein [Paractinoplanes brasiliensis]|uniref:hypothetical protein n=1 Tax=Paractinoplanes brasiliensis TaxID=52695 RepID=UPI001060BD66|nr:hypothetical protein [Actinoplanes brasiliensis]GID29948.1 hypothetical protein Abr02nite_49310 [Actinoplanes brasiliensis]
MPKSRKRPAKKRRALVPTTIRTPTDPRHVVSDRATATSVDLAEEIRRATADTVAHGRLLLTRDPTLATLTHRREAKGDGRETEPGEWWPVALVEPVNYRLLQFDDLVYPLSTAIAGKLGLAQAQVGETPPAAANWEFHDGPRCELVDPTGTVLARFRHAIDPQWRAAAETSGTVLVLYGGQLGVRTPYGVTAAEYDDRARDAELQAALAGGELLTGAVTYVQN